MKCKVGDAVNLWVAEESKEIFIYKQGLDFGEGKIGICPDEFFRVISTALDCEASIGSIYDNGCKIICRLLSKAEVDKRIENMKEVEEKKVQEKRQMNLLNHEKKKIGEIRTTDIVLRIIKAHYNGYHFDINMVSFDNHAYYPHAEIEIVPKKFCRSG